MLPGNARAQRAGVVDVWLEAGAARIQQPMRPRADAAIVSVGAQRSGRSLMASTALAVTSAQDSVGAGQANVGFSYVLPWRVLRTDFGASGSSFGVPAPDRARSGAALVRQHAGWTHGGLFVSAARGETRRVFREERNPKALHLFHATSLDAGAWAAWRFALLSVTAQRTLTNDYALAEANNYRLGRDTRSYDFRDVAVNAGVRWSRLELLATGAWRDGASATIGHSHALSVSARLQVTRSVALVATQGEQLADVLRGIPQAKVSSLSMRWSPFGIRRPVAAAPSMVEPAANGGIVTISVRAKPDAVVDYATSTGDWQPIRMAHDGRHFVSRVPMPSGTHRVAVRVNGGAWSAPDGFVRVKDDLGGSAGLVVVPQ